MKLLVTGVKGQLGHDIVNECNNRNIEAVGVDVEEMDITDAGKVAEVIKSGNYNAVIHCAAWTAVDKAEDDLDGKTAVLRHVRHVEAGRFFCGEVSEYILKELCAA